jgi:thiopeptide-type bacteriocin biosynthesis protein
MYQALPTFLLRAPLLPERDWRRRGALAAHPLGADALALASLRLAAATDSPERRRALDRYGRRAAFRATPSGLLAGVCVGALGRATRIETGTPRPHLAPTWARLAALGRALLDDEATRVRTRLRAAPSLARGATTARWLAPGEPFAEERAAALDGGLGELLDATRGWTDWPAARRAARRLAGGAGRAALDDVLLLLVDDGLLQADVTPPLVGRDAAAWMQARLGRLGREDLGRALAAAQRALERGDLAQGAAALEALPGAALEALPGEASDRGVHGVLVHRPRRPPTLARAAVARAAALAPLLFRLQEVLAAPASERLAQPALEEALDATTELCGAGALDLGAFDAGDYGVPPVDVEGDHGLAARAAAPAPALLTVLVDTIVAAARERRAEAALDADALAAALGELEPAPPPTCELFLAPAAGRGGPEGAGWLLGLHAPAGSSWGRFAAALGAPLARALEALAQAERASRPDEEALDVSFTPSPALADLCAHPRARRRALALSAWPDDDGGDDRGDLTPSDLELVADPSAAAPLALRPRAGGGPVAPSPLARVRSATAPAGTTRLLAGWSLFRQHAPWALALGPLAALAHVPRLTLDGFVVAPASWRLPEALRAAGADRAARAGRATLGRWRREARPPRFVQVGHEDQLLVVDLEDADAAAELAGHERAWEIWPPLGRGVDHDGRRVEAVVALVDRPDDDEARASARAARAVAAAPRVPPPRLAAPPPGWRTFEIFGAPDHQDALLVEAIRPAMAAARRAREVDGWFFQRYVAGPGRRHRLRLRVHTATPRARAAFDARLADALAPARAAGAVVSVAAGDYHAERERFGGELDAAHAVFESDSEAACALLALEAGADDVPDRLTATVRTLDALARGLGLGLDARHELARARRAAAEATDPVDDDARAAADAAFRERARALRAVLGATALDGATRALDAHAARTGRATRRLSTAARAALAPSLLHLACVRLAGPDRALERLAYTCWERALEGLRRAPTSSRRAG